MKFAFDPGKDASNQEKHGLSVEQGDWTAAFIALDDRRDYGEFRWYVICRSRVGFTSPSIPNETM
ncbi:MAG: hypothetical protein ACK4OJ_12845 [Brevundimonas sp.]